MTQTPQEMLTAYVRSKYSGPILPATWSESLRRSGKNLSPVDPGTEKVYVLVDQQIHQLARCGR